VERDQLSRLLRENAPLLDKAAEHAPSKVEIAALAAFYTGIENVFGRIHADMHGAKPSGEAWHKNLLQAMARETDGGAPMISQPLCDILSEYLTFRHVFRQAYTYDIRWDKMEPLIRSCRPAFKQLSDELAARCDGL
jgi:hypothetical protein